MRDEAKGIGLYRHDLIGRDYDRVRIVTVREIVEEDGRLEIPMSLEVLRKAQGVKQDGQLQLLDAETGQG